MSDVCNKGNQKVKNWWHVQLLWIWETGWRWDSPCPEWISWQISWHYVSYKTNQLKHTTLNCIELILLFLYIYCTIINFLYLLIHKYVHQRTKLPAIFSTYLGENKLVHHYTTRQKDDFHTNVVQSEMGKRAVKYKGSKLWNNLPTELKEIRSLRSVKYKLRSHLLQSLL